MRIGEYPQPSGRSARKDDDGRTARPADRDASPAATPGDTRRLEAEVLLRLGFGKPLVAQLADRATRNDASVESELLSESWLDREAYYAALARALRLPYLDDVDAACISDHPMLDTQLVQPSMVRLQHPRSAPVTVIVPEAAGIPATLEMLARLPSLRDSMAVASASSVRRAVWRAGATRRVRNTVNHLFEWRPHFSARIVFWGRQGFYTGIAVTTAAIAALLATEMALLALHVLMSLLFFTALCLRIAAVRHCRTRARPIEALPDTTALPVYTVMVALYHEADVASQLVSTLNRLNWPASRLDIKLVCEADDRETIAALVALRPGPQFEIVEVPPMQPRTKPKALSYALPAARGAYLAIYDAEDRPHPDQLLEAYGRFRTAAADIACLQAPLIVTNARASWLSALFSLEYSALFRGLLPMLAHHRMPLPLGGTSNHFRTEILRAAGGWDPYNVTEDADLGMRLYRLGYRSDVILRQTLEDAPTETGVWMAQRTRWFKGWLQTWLVMMRDPRRLQTEMGMRAFLIFHLLIGGMLVSSLAHPFILMFLFVTLFALMESPAEQIPLLYRALFAIDIVNILGSYCAFLAVGAMAMIRHEKKLVGWRWIGIPVYWMMVSWAAWRAIAELRSNPFFWHKTPHLPHDGGDAKSAGAG